MTATGRFGGTYLFMPREQLTEFRYVRPTSDIWSLAATFYNMLTGCYPLNFGKSRDPMEVILRDEPAPLRDRDGSIPAPLAAAIDRALSTDPKRRYPNAGEFQGGRQACLRVEDVRAAK